MTEYIKKELLIKEATEDGAYDYVDVRQINDMPTIDIVHCKVCKYWSLEKELTRLNGERYAIGYCCLEDKYSDHDWFCADGERR